MYVSMCMYMCIYVCVCIWYYVYGICICWKLCKKNSAVKIYLEYIYNIYTYGPEVNVIGLYYYVNLYAACSSGEIYSPSVHCPVQIHGKTRKQRLLSTEQNPS